MVYCTRSAVSYRWFFVMSHHHITVLLLLISSAAAVAADAVRVAPTTSVPAGLRVDVPVTGTLDQASGPGRLVFRYNPSALRIVGARGGDGAAFDCASIPLADPVVTSATEATVTLDCDRTIATADGVLCTLTVEAMADATGPHAIEPVALFVNGQPSPDASLVPGTLLVAGTGVHREVVEGITGNYPNPFSTQTRFEYRVAGTGTVSFTIRDSRGRVMMVLDDVDRTPGTYSLDLTAKTWEFSTGAYLLQMTTMTDSYLHPFVVVK